MDILVIDDNKEITEMISFFLDIQNISCQVVNEGRKGLLKIINEKYDAILLDLTMPEFSGFDLFNILKEENLLKQNNILLFTASYISDEDIQDMISDGVRGVLRKPVSIDNIIEVLSKFS
jgi:CheY-like chemotaxis protein